MPVMSASALLLAPLAPLAVAFNDLDPVPEPEDVKAGYPALFIFLGLLVVVGLLGWSLFRHLRQTDANRRAGMFGDVPEAREVTAPVEPRDLPATDADGAVRDDRRPPGGGTTS